MRALLGKISKYLLFAALLAACVYILQPGYAKYVEHRNEIGRLEAEIEALEAERARLEKDMQALEEEDPEYIERLAREKLHLVKPGETIFRFKPKQ